MLINLIFILVNIMILLLISVINKIEKFNMIKHKLIIVKNNDLIFIHIKNLNTQENKIYKIYKK